jgi:hypothetical protein
MLESFEPREIYELIRDNHLPRLAEGDLALLAARACGFSVADIAKRTFVGVRTARLHFERVEELICVPAGVPNSPVTAGWWLGQHTNCEQRCAAAAIDMILHDTIFSVLIASHGRRRGSRRG